MKKKKAKKESEIPSDLEDKIVKGLRSGQKLLGEDGILTDLVQRVVNAALEGEASSHVSASRSEGYKNRRNGHTHKTVKSDVGPLSISTPRDRSGSYEPQLIGKWQRDLGTGVADQILRLYARGLSNRDIKSELYDLYGLEYGTGSISGVIDRISGEVVSWQNRPLLSFYTVIFLDAIYYKVRVNGKVVKQAVYTVYGIDHEGNRDVLSLSIHPTEGAMQWGRILEDLANRGIEDVLFFCVDGLKGFSEAIEEVFPDAIVQQCIVHKIRSSTRFVSDKDIKAICRDLRTIYTAPGIEDAELALEAFEQKWDVKYPKISKAWREDWAELVSFLDFKQHIRRMIYTTNSVEALHRLMRKVTKSKGAWTNEQSLIKQLYLTLQHNTKSWNRKVFHWSAIQRDLDKHFGERFTQWFD